MRKAEETITALLIVRNEQENLPECLARLKWADEIIVVDTGSTDRTREIAEANGARVFGIEWQGYGDAKQRGLEWCTSTWVLSVDADERVTDDLAKEITEAIGHGHGISGYYLNRLTYFLGRPIKHCGWFPDYVLRLFRRESARIEPKPVHESFETSGKTLTLDSLLLHHSDPTLAHYVKKMNVYTDLSAQEVRDSKTASFANLVLRPPATFLRMYVLKLGFLDGWEGFLLSVLSSVHVFLKYAKAKMEKGLPCNGTAGMQP